LYKYGFLISASLAIHRPTDHINYREAKRQNSDLKLLFLIVVGKVESLAQLPVSLFKPDDFKAFMSGIPLKQK
jgi:hypothetical protein